MTYMNNLTKNNSGHKSPTTGTAAKQKIESHMKSLNPQDFHLKILN